MGAQQHAESQTPQTHQAREEDPTARLKPTGRCHNCAVQVDDRIIFCSAFCDQEWRRFHR